MLGLMPGKRVSVRDVAANAGVSRMTVSRALRHDPRVAQATAERVRRIAGEMGYKPNPMLSSLMSNIRAGRLEKRSHVIAFLVSHRSWQAYLRRVSLRLSYQGAVRRGNEIGFTVQPFFLGEPGMDAARMSEILCARNIQGVILAPAHDPGHTLALRWSSFSSAIIGYSWAGPPLHRVANHHAHTIRLALDKLVARGCRRIGLIQTSDVNTRVDQSFLAGLTLYQSSVRPKDRIPFFFPPQITRKTFLEWFRKTQPDALIGSNPSMVKWLREEGWEVPGQIAYVNLDYSPEFGDIAAVNQNPEYVGAAAVETVAEQIYHNERGVPAKPKVVMIEGEWVPGGTL